MQHTALHIRGGRIESAAGSERPRLFIDGAELELPSGAVLVPGLVDTHCHLIGLGLMASRVVLQGAGSAAECARRTAERAAATPKGEWILGFGWNQEEWDVREMPDKHDLDELVPDHPVFLSRIDSHMAWLNSAALRAAGIEVTEMEGGRVVAGEDGTPNGILIDTAMALAERATPKPTPDQQRRWIEWSVQECLRLGITEVHDMNVEPERMEGMIRAAEGGGMNLRCQVFLAAQKEEWRAFPDPGAVAPNLHLAGVKYFADGALGSRGALLLEPYSDAPDTCGLQLLSASELEGLAAPAAARGFAVATHSIGDGANRLVLDAYERLRGRYPEALLRVEHAQIVHPDDVPRFASLGVIAAMQAIHYISDASMTESRLGPVRCAYAYGWGALRQLGVPVLGGSDFPVESADPLAGLRAYHFREPVPGAGPRYPRQAISREDALAAYTSRAPLGIPGVHRRGRLEPGYDADITVLDGDPFNAATQAVMTIVGGKVVYERT